MSTHMSAKMAEIRLQVPDDLMTKLKSKLGLRNNKEVIEEALTMLSWAADEKDRKRVILSATTDGDQVTRLAMKSLNLVPSPAHS